MKRLTLKKNLMMTALVAVLAIGLAGCGTKSTQSQANVVTDPSVAGTILLAVNPEIEIDYDDKGLVLEIEGVNEDGKTIAANFNDYQGEPSETVASELVRRIYDAGYFESTIDGNVKNIVVMLEKGSTYPDDDFLEKIAEEVRQALSDSGVKSEAMMIDDDDMDQSGMIGLEKAKELVLAQLGLDEATFTETEYELDDGVYEFEFTANGIEYEFEVDAYTGKIMKADYENNDDWDDEKDDDLDDEKDDDLDDDQDDDLDDDQDDDIDDDRDDDIDDDQDDGINDDQDDDRDDDQDDDMNDDQDDDMNEDQDDDMNDDQDDDMNDDQDDDMNDDQDDDDNDDNDDDDDDDDNDDNDDDDDDDDDD